MENATSDYDAPGEPDYPVIPDPEYRRLKTQVENELLIKLGSRRERIDWHPLIKARKLERAKTFVSLDYKPKDVSTSAQSNGIHPYNAWSSDNLAMRQLSNISRHGPRTIYFNKVIRQQKELQFPDIEMAEKRRKKYEARHRKVWELLLAGTVPSLPSRINIMHKTQLDSIKLEQREMTESDLSADFTLKFSKSANRRRITLDKIFNDLETEYLWRKKTSMRKEVKQTAVMRKVQTGDLSKFPDIPKTEVRIYLCSTPDLRDEREYLAEVAYPELRTFCERYGLGFHVVDLRHGINTLRNDLETFRLCQWEIKKCRKLSIGPNFITLIGNRVDDHKLPSHIQFEDYDQIRELVIKEHLTGLELLDECYRLNSNISPPVYQLQLEGEERKKFGKISISYETTDDIVDGLHRLLHEAVTLLVNLGALGPEYKHNYKWLVTHQEVEEGLFGSVTTQEDCLGFFVTESNAQSNKETPSSSACEFADSIVNHYFGTRDAIDNLVQIDAPPVRDLQYLKTFGDIFVQNVKRLIQRAIRVADFDIRDHVTPHAEAMSHIHICNTKCQQFQGRREILKQVETFIKDCLFKRKPLVIHGKAGVGKTQVMAMAAKSMCKWKERSKVVVRFVGTSTDSSRPYNLFQSLYSQLSTLFGVKTENATNIRSINDLNEVVRKLLFQISDQIISSSSLVLIVDGLDKLKDGEEFCSQPFFSEELPFAVFIMLSTRSHHPTLHALQKQINDPSCFLEIKGMTDPSTRAHVSKALIDNERKITTDQMKVLIGRLVVDSRPLFINLLLTEAIKWPSHRLPFAGSLKRELKDAVVHYLNRIEEKLGRTFSKYATSYLAAAKYGLAEHELLHLLLHNVSLLNDIKAEEANMSVIEGYHFRQNVSRLFFTMQIFLTETHLEGETIVMLNADQMSDGIKSRYMSNDDFGCSIHYDLASYFLHHRRGLFMGAGSSAESGMIKYSRINLRTLRCAPYHLTQAHCQKKDMRDMIKEHVLCNFSWIENKINLTNFRELLEDYEMSNEMLNDDELEALHGILIQLRTPITHDPMCLAALLPTILQSPSKIHVTFKGLIAQAREWQRQSPLPSIFPVLPNSFPIGGLQVRRILGQFNLIDVTSNGKLAIVTDINDSLSTYDIDLGETNTELQSTLYVSTASAKLTPFSTLACHHTDCVAVWDVNYGKRVSNIPLKAGRAIWLETTSSGDVLVARDNSIFIIDIRNGASDCFRKYISFIIDAAVSRTEPDIVATLHGTVELKLYIASRLNKSVNSITLGQRSVTNECKPLAITRDNRFVCVTLEKEVMVVAVEELRLLYSLSHGRDPISCTHLTRSSEHIFIADTIGLISLWKLRNGDDVCKFKSSTDFSVSNSEVMTSVQSMVTSEDDHFLICGLVSGHVYMFHVPTQLQILIIQAHSTPVHQLIFSTVETRFQHLYTCSMDSSIKVWDLRFIIREVKSKLMPYIHDDDLLREETPKLNLREYVTLYRKRHDSSMFLNGADIGAFFKIPSSNLFTYLQDLDPKVCSYSFWLQTRELYDNRQVTCFKLTKNTNQMVTFSNKSHLTEWNVEGPLLNKTFQIANPIENVIDCWSIGNDKLIMVYGRNKKQKDGTVKMWSINSGNERLSIAAVRACGCTLDRKHLLVLGADKKGMKIRVWDLQNRSPKKEVSMPGAPLSAPDSSCHLSDDLQSAIWFSKSEKDHGIIVVVDLWTLLNPDKEKALRNFEWDDSLSVSSDRPASRASVTSLTRPFQAYELHAPITRSQILSDYEILIGMADGHVLIFDICTADITKVFTQGVIKTVDVNINSLAGRELSEALGASRPHEGAISFLLLSGDRSHLLVGTTTELSVWNVRERHISQCANVEKGQITSAALSEDHSVLVAGTTEGIVHVWGVYPPAVLCSLHLQAPILQVDITHDRKKIMALIDEVDEKRLLFLETRNIS